ncbi:MAG: serine/threonine protein kinase [Planctomycetes bacterium]|nr:serine/threonine protein kinase [Planctomycetota bacterium]
MNSEPPVPASAPDWEAFYANYRKPGYVTGFEISSKLGGGMFGLVFKARRQSIGKDYAIKFLKVDDTEVRRAVLAELEQVRFFAEIDHPNLVSIEDRGEIDGIPFIVMAYAGAETLKDKLPGDATTRPDLVRYFLQACRGVAALHERSLVHFDLKPANVFLKGGVARVGDYGLSKLVTHSRGSLSMGRGTPYYMAPEMLQRRGDARSDIYSLGVMLYEIVCGDVPFKGDSEWEVLRKHEHEPPQFLPGVGKRERAVIERCLAKNPDQRFQSVHDLIGALGAPVSLDAPVLQPPPVPSQLPPMPTDPVRSKAKSEAAEFVANAYQPPPLPARQRRWFRAGVLLPVLIVLGFLWLIPAKLESRSPRAVASARPAMPQPVDTPRELSPVAQLREFERSLATRLTEINKRRAKVPTLQDVRVQVRPSDLDQAEQMVEAFGMTGEFSEGHALKLERLGYSTFLAGVELLQRYDYDDEDECRAAAVVGRLLVKMVPVQGLSVEVPSGGLDRTVQVRLRVVADQWRRLVEQMAARPDQFQGLVESLGVARRGVGVNR